MNIGEWGSIRVCGQYLYIANAAYAPYVSDCVDSGNYIWKTALIGKCRKLRANGGDRETGRVQLSLLLVEWDSIPLSPAVILASQSHTLALSVHKSSISVPNEPRHLFGNHVPRGELDDVLNPISTKRVVSSSRPRLLPTITRWGCRWGQRFRRN